MRYTGLLNFGTREKLYSLITAKLSSLTEMRGDIRTWAVYIIIFHSVVHLGKTVNAPVQVLVVIIVFLVPLLLFSLGILCYHVGHNSWARLQFRSEWRKRYCSTVKTCTWCLNIVSANIFFPLGKMISMVRSRTSFILSSQSWEIGIPPTGGAGRMKLSCVVPASVMHI